MTVTATPRPTGHPGYTETLPCETQSAKAARRLVLVALAVWGQEQLTDDGQLIVTELVANAAQHTSSHLIRVRITFQDDAFVRIGVVDRSHRLPAATAPGDDDTSGRGLALIDALATQWGCDPLPWGKRVWADLTCERNP